MVASAGLCWRGQTHAFWERVQVSLRQRSGLIGRRSLLNSIDVPGYRSIRVGKGMKRVLGLHSPIRIRCPNNLRETAVWRDLLAWMLRQRPRMGFLRFELRCIDALGRRRLRGGLRRCRLWSISQVYLIRVGAAGQNIVSSSFGDIPTPLSVGSSASPYQRRLF